MALVDRRAKALIALSASLALGVALAGCGSAAAPARPAGDRTVAGADVSPSLNEPATPTAVATTSPQATDRACSLLTAQEAAQAGGFTPVPGVSDTDVTPKSAVTPDGVVRQCRFGADSASHVIIGADVFPNATAALEAYGKWKDLFVRTLTNAPVDLDMSGAVGPKGKAMQMQDDLTPAASIFFVEGPVVVHLAVAAPGADQAPVAAAKNLAVIAASRVPQLAHA
jgi:hypothetical protein